jgi:hypothetical protein
VAKVERALTKHSEALTGVDAGRWVQEESRGVETRDRGVGQPAVRGGEEVNRACLLLLSALTSHNSMQASGSPSPSFCQTLLENISKEDLESECDIRWTANSMYAEAMDTVRGMWMSPSLALLKHGDVDNYSRAALFSCYDAESGHYETCTGRARCCIGSGSFKVTNVRR